ncbi:MAG: hypothetical protein JOZ96_20740 [Acidobacteria bacterium]|nr:hypothetical protein [Acidobacteriota bacterium]
MSTPNGNAAGRELSQAKRALLERRLRGAVGAVTSPPGIPRRERREVAPVSYVQEESWRLEREGRLPTPFLGTALHFAGRLDLAALARSRDEAVRRHESLRTNFAFFEGQPAQLIRPFTPGALSALDLSGAGAPADEARRQIAREMAAPFDLERDELFRLRVYKLAAEEYVLLLVLHHLVADFLSLGLLVGELGALYEAHVNGRPAPLPETPVQYGDWAAWQREQVASGALDSQLSYWRARLRGCPPALDLPFARPRPAARSFSGVSRLRGLPEELSQTLRELSRRHAVSLYTTLLAAFYALVRHYTGRADIVLGRGIPGRTRSETDGLVGCFVNMLALRTDVGGDPTFLELLGRVGETVNGAYANQEVPFAVLARELEPDPDPARPPLVQLVFNLYGAPPAQPPAGTRLSVFDLRESRPRQEIALFQDMIFGVNDTGRTLGLELKYNPGLFDAAAMEEMLADYEALLTAAAADPAARLGELAAQSGIGRPPAPVV